MRAVAALLVAALLAAPSLGDGMRGHLAVHGERILATEGAEQLFTPASVQKIVVSAAALHYLGPHHQIETVVRARGAVSGGILHGDLVLEAAGDPTWSRTFFPDDPEAPLRVLAEQVRGGGIVRVDGDLLVDLARFPGRRAPTSRSQAEMGLGFGAPVSGLAIDENVVELRVAAGRRVGERASVTSSARVELRNDTVTAPAARHGKGSIEFLPQWGHGAIRVRGEYPASEPPYTVRVSLPAPELAVGERLRDLLWRAGVEVTGTVRVASSGSGDRAASSAVRRPGGDVARPAVIARVLSPPLVEIVGPVLRDSSNWTAEMLVVLVALARTGEGRYDDGVEALGRFLIEDVGVAEDAFALDDASGLSPENLLSPQTVVAVLRFAWRSPWRDAFVGGLARPGTGTLAVWPALPPVAAKTGTLKHTVGLAGMLALDGSTLPPAWTVAASSSAARPSAGGPASPPTAPSAPLDPAAPEAAAALGVADAPGPPPGTPLDPADVSRPAGESPPAAATAPADSTLPPAASVAPAPASEEEPIFFAIFLNHDLRDRGLQRREIADLLRSWRRLVAGSS